MNTQMRRASGRVRLGAIFALLCGFVACEPETVTSGNASTDNVAAGDSDTGSSTTPMCGNGVLDAPEVCDDGPLNSDTNRDACRLDCTLPRCGDGVVDLGELCDDGNGRTDDACPDGWPAGCRDAECGDGYVHVGIEECDASSANSDTAPDQCRLTCLLPSCGDGTADEGEGCDDGNQDDSDSCPDGDSGSCQSAHCGDGVLRRDITDPNTPGYEACDDGADNSDTSPNACRSHCAAPACGDAVVDGQEQCDLGALNSDTAADMCRTSCRAPACGDGVIDVADRCDVSVVNRNRYPTRLAHSGDGTLYATDSEVGSVFVYDNDLALKAEIKGIPAPLGVAATTDGLLYVGSNELDEVAVFGIAGERIGTVGAGTLLMPNDLEVDDHGNLYVADSIARVVRVYDAEGIFVRTIGVPDDRQGSLLPQELGFPIAVTLDFGAGEAAGTVYVADQHHCRIVAFDAEGSPLRVLGSCRKVITEWHGKFAKLQGMTLDQYGRIHAADTQLPVQIIDPLTGAYISHYGQQGTEPGELNLPLDICFGNDRRIAVANNGNHRVEEILVVP